MKKLFLFAMAAVALASCSESDELALSQAQQEAGRGEVAFSVYANRTTRAGKEGVMDMTNLQGEKAGFGIFGYHTNNSLYDPQNSEPNFMYNQRVTWNTGENKWTYDPVKYWPNEFGENAVSNDIDYVSFFAYAPYVEFDPISGVALMPEMPETDEPLTPEKESQLKNQIQWKNITGASRNGDKGDPFIRYKVDTNPSTSVDLMWGVAADNSFRGLANPSAVTVNPDECFINLSKQIGVDQTINWKFYHALAKLDVQIVAACDVATEGTTEYTPDEESIPVDPFTGVYLRWIEFSGFAMSGALSLNSKAPQAHWLNYDGATELKAPTIRFNDGLLNGKEGIANNVNPNEVVLGALNPVIIEEPTPLEGPIVDGVETGGWTAKKKGIPTDQFVNVFDGATVDETTGVLQNSIFVIPTNAPLTINMLYDIETKDTQLNKYLSDGVTPGTRISNEITQELRNVNIVAGRAYTIKIVVGLESVKVDVEENGVAEWENATGEKGAKFDMPYNPAEPLAVGMTGTFFSTSEQRPFHFDVIEEVENPETHKQYLKVKVTPNKRYPNDNIFYFLVEKGTNINNGVDYKTYNKDTFKENGDDDFTAFKWHVPEAHFVSPLSFSQVKGGTFYKSNGDDPLLEYTFTVSEGSTPDKVRITISDGATWETTATNEFVNDGYQHGHPNNNKYFGYFVVE